ncbi:MAG: hypothetical protein HC800_07400 [Phormidesmis sp. RL_2_1]|nr:hypothetical protein [Phormidesmis sp. RL_2_1]
MDRIQVQASKLWDLLFAEETAETYQNTLNLTGTILKEIAQLIWLIICSFFVFGAWFSETSVKAGSSIRRWVDEQSNPSSASADTKDLTATGKDLLETGRTGIVYLLNQARQQLGIDPVEAPQKPTKIVNSPPAAPADPPSSAPDAPAKAAPAKPVADSKPVTSTAASSTVTETSREDADDDWPPQEADD